MPSLLDCLKTVEIFDPLGHYGQRAEMEFLVELCWKANSGSPATVVEVGSYVGLSALCMAAAGHTVYCVDTFQGTVEDAQDELGQTARKMRQTLGDGIVLDTFLKNTKDRLFKSIFPCVGESTLWAKRWPFPVDMVFIDANHSYDSCLADIHGWRPHVKPGGILCGHDFGPFPGVERAVSHLLSDKFNVKETIWWTQI